MFGKIAAAVAGMIVGAGGILFSYNYHVVRAEKEWLCLPRKQASLSDTYADIRGWRAGDWEGHGELAKSLVAHGRSDLVIAPAAKGLFEDLLDGLNGPRRVGEADGDNAKR